MTNTTLEDRELKIRAERAEKTPFIIRTLGEAHFPFTDYEVRGETKARYIVEIRSLQEKINSCSCPDFHVNTLSTCKHIEGVLHFLRKKSKRRFAQFSHEGSKRVEIFVDPSVSETRLRWPLEIENVEEIKALINPYLSATQIALIDPANAILSIENSLKELPEAIVSKVRISPHLRQWLTEHQFIQNREDDKKNFLSDVETGKRSLQMLTCKLFPYQEEGMLHLAFKGKAILADDMGLGKTIQAIAACELLRRLNRVQRVVIVSPASLKGEWEEQIKRFSGLSTVLVNGSRADRLASYKKNAFFYLMNYEQVRVDYEEIQILLNPDILVLDEAQRIKNWETKTAWAVKRIKAPYAFVLTGTPIENRIDELYSIMQVIDPKILGPLFKFNQKFYEFDEKGKPTKYKNLSELHHRLQTVLLRRRKKDVEEQLPERTIKNYFIKMGAEQTARYEETSLQVSRLLKILKKRPFTPEESKKLQRLLACMRMIADTPYILDEECRECPKLEELEEILKAFLEDSDNKIIIFSEWERMLFLVRELAHKLEINYGWHTGSVPQDKRRDEIRRFKEDPGCRLFLSSDSGSVGLNLQIANVVINLDLPWNPAKLEQRIARAWRKNQTRLVQVINLITEHTIEHRMLSTLAMKQAVADIVLDATQDIDEMPLPSASRQDFIKKIEELTGFSSDAQQVAPLEIEREETITSVNFKQELLARHSDRIHLLEKHENASILVVDKVDQALKDSVNQISSTPVEILDFETYSTLQKLAEGGLIHFSSKSKEVLFQSHLIVSMQQKGRKHHLEEAITIYKEVERKVKMINLLKSGGFMSESLPAVREAFSKCLDIYRILGKGVDHDALWLKENLENPENLELFLNYFSNWTREMEATLKQFALGINPSQNS